MLEQLLPGPLREVAQDQPPDGSASLWKSQRPDPSTIGGLHEAESRPVRAWKAVHGRDALVQRWEQALIEFWDPSRRPWDA
jgi:hypothetical protein